MGARTPGGEAIAHSRRLVVRLLARRILAVLKRHPEGLTLEGLEGRLETQHRRLLRSALRHPSLFNRVVQKTTAGIAIYRAVRSHSPRTVPGGLPSLGKRR